MIYSYSAIATYKQCPAKFKYAYIDRVQVDSEPPSPAMERGTKIHNSVEDYLLRKNEFLHPDIHADYGQFMMGLRESGDLLLPEFKWGITWEFKPCEYDAKDCMLHGYMDLLVIPQNEEANLPVYEWKTGKKYPEHTKQTHVYAIAAMCHYPDRPGVDTMATYFDQQDYKKVMYPATMMFDYKSFLRAEIGRIADATRFPTMPSFKCKWCKFSRHNGGPCNF